MLAVDDRHIYWIETEIIKRRQGNCSLALEMIGEQPLDPDTLESLLDIGARKKGVWRLPLPFGKGTFVAVRQSHIPLNEGLSPNMFLHAFAKLTNEKKNRP